MRRAMNKLRYLFLLLAFAVLVPSGSALADEVVNVGSVISLNSLSTSGDIVLCDVGTPCNAFTPAANIAGVGVFYLSLTGPFTPDVGPADTVTLLGGSQLNFFLTNFPGGFSPNAVFLDVGTKGTASFGGFTFDTSTSAVATPEPSILPLLALGLIVLIWRSSRRFTIA